MKLFKVMFWLSGALFLIVAANHFFNPNFTGNMTLFFALAFAMFTFSGIDGYLNQRKKTATLHIFIGAICFFALIVDVVGVDKF